LNSGVKRCWPLAGSSRGVGSRDGTHKKAPETRGGIRGRTCPGLDPGRPAQGGGAGKTICPTVSVKYRPKHFVRVPVAVDPQSILASFVQVLRRWDRRLHGCRRYDFRDEGGRAASGTAAESNGRFRRPCLTRHLCILHIAGSGCRGEAASATPWPLAAFAHPCAAGRGSRLPGM